MAATPQIVPAAPVTQELVTNAVLFTTGLNAQAFSGNLNPQTIWRTMVDGTPNVFPYYREVEEKDTAVSSAIEVRKLNVMAREAKVQAADAEKNSQAQQYAEGLKEFLDSIPQWRRSLWELLDAPGTVPEVASALGGSCAAAEEVIELDVGVLLGPGG